MNNQDNLIGVIETLFRYKKLLLRVIGAAVIGSIIISLLLPVYYQSTTSFYAASIDLSNPDKLFGNGTTESQYYGNAEDIDRLLTIAEGAEVANFLIEKYNLYNHYDIDSTGKKASFNIRRHFNSLYNVQKTKLDAIELTIEDQDRELAAAMANDARLKIEEISKRMIKESQMQQMKAFEQSITDSEQNLITIGDSLMVLRSRYGIYDPETQGEMISSLFAATQLQKSKLEGKLESYKNTPGTPRDSIRKVSAELSGTDSQLTKLDENLKLFNEGSATVITLSDLHETARNQINWDKERYKHIKSAYNANSPAIHLVEKAEPAVVKSRPIRSLIVIGSVIITFLAMVIGILLFENYKEVDWNRIVSGKPASNGIKEKKKIPA